MRRSMLYRGWRLLTLGLLVSALALGAACSSSSGQAAATRTDGADAAPGASAPETQAAGRTAREQVRGMRLVTVATGLASPVYVTAFASEPSRLYVVEQAGRIRVIEKGRVLAEPFLDITSQVKSGGEQGLLSVAFHPRYATNGLFYVDYTDTSGDTRVVEYRARDGRTPARVRELLFVDQPYANHNGGDLQFGPDGLLYVGMGDGGSGGDPENHAQDLSSRLGKLLRIDVDAAGADWEAVGYGLRNPWRFSFDRRTGDLYVADVGQNEWEEIDYVAASNTGLLNYGWDVFEGTHQYEDKGLSGNGKLVQPIYQYSHANGCSVTGGYVYRGTRVAAAKGRYFFGDYCSGRIWSLVVKNGKATSVRRHPFRVDALSSFGENARGELFLVSQEGTIYRLANA